MKRKQTKRPVRRKWSGKESSNKLKIIVLGGLEEVGRNMTLIEYGNDIILIDMGLQFPEEYMPGIDFIIPDVTYLEDKIKKIKGIIITHGHLDHIGAISYLMPKLGFPPIYTAKLTAGIIQKRHEEFKTQKLNIQLVDPEKDNIQLGKLKVNFFRVNHNIPDSFGVVVNSPVGTIVHTGDFKIDFNPVNDKPANLNRIAQIGSNGVLALMADSTSAMQPGYQISESSISEDIDKIYKEAPGRIIIGTFASSLNRVQQLITIAERYGKKVYLDGRSMVSNVEIAHKLGYLKIKPGTIVEQGPFLRLPANKQVVIGTGAQGESNAVLMRIANNDHRFLSIAKGDTVIFSSSVIPGNERTIQSLKDTLTRQGAKLYHYQMMDVHAGGHAKQEDVKMLIRLLKPQYYIPIEANHFMLRGNAEVAESLGIPTSNIFIADNGQVIEFTKRGKSARGILTKNRVPAEYVMVDGLGVGDISNIVLRDRRQMSEDGMFVVIATVSRKTGDLIGSPDIISRGFIYMKESRQLVEDARSLVRKIVKDKNSKCPSDPNEIKNRLRNEVGSFLFKKTKRRPMVLPVVIEI